MHSIRLTIIILAISIAGAANATVWVFNDPVDASQVVPPTGELATGTAVGTYDDVTNMLNINVAVGVFNAIYPPTAAHIHRAPFGANGGVFHVLGVAGGVNYTNPNTNFVLNAAQEVDFLNNLYYVQIHTSLNPGGAVRGQLNPVPEPASLFALGIGALVLARRRRRKA
ncbi:MAG: CHRD domain-containing protein [Armatimonadetes bacterium]|nr:CHRD domain-containing protein [Armatimonadota bacterium]